MGTDIHIYVYDMGLLLDCYLDCYMTSKTRAHCTHHLALGKWSSCRSLTVAMSLTTAASAAAGRLRRFAAGRRRRGAAFGGKKRAVSGQMHARRKVPMHMDSSANGFTSRGDGGQSPSMRKP